MRALCLILFLIAAPATAQTDETRCKALGAAYNMALGLRDSGLPETGVLQQVAPLVPAGEACHLPRVVRRALLSNTPMSREAEASWVSDCTARTPPLGPCS